MHPEGQRKIECMSPTFFWVSDCLTLCCFDAKCAFFFAMHSSFHPQRPHVQNILEFAHHLVILSHWKSMIIHIIHDYPMIIPWYPQYSHSKNLDGLIQVQDRAILPAPGRLWVFSVSSFWHRDNVNIDMALSCFEHSEIYDIIIYIYIYIYMYI